jgi:hypothetical protein
MRVASLSSLHICIVDGGKPANNQNYPPFLVAVTVAVVFVLFFVFVFLLVFVIVFFFESNVKMTCTSLSSIL